MAGSRYAVVSKANVPYLGDFLEKLSNDVDVLESSGATEALPAHLDRVDTSMGGLSFTYWSNGGDIDDRHPAVERAVLILHGSNQDAASYGMATIDAASLHGVDRSTLVVAPEFPETASVTRLWWSGGWREGDPSENGDQLSSFEVLDRIVASIRVTYGTDLPVVVAGHSAGAQFVHRYAAGTTADITRFLVANPSTFLYFTPTRWRADGSVIADPAATDPGWDTYKYGLSGLNAYMSARPGHAARYASKNVVILNGEGDTSRSSSLDTSAAADLQGANRLERGLIFYAHLAEQLGSVPPGHTRSVVPGIGHDGRAMLTSAEGRAALFQDGAAQ